jgi:hypothetical protein
LNVSNFWVVSDSIFTEECILKGSSTAELSLNFHRVASSFSQVEIKGFKRLNTVWDLGAL